MSSALVVTSCRRVLAFIGSVCYDLFASNKTCEVVIAFASHCFSYSLCNKLTCTSQNGPHVANETLRQWMTIWLWDSLSDFRPSSDL